MTEYFEQAISGLFPEPMDELDKEFKDQVVFVWNQVLQNLRYKGWTKEAIEPISRLLFRLYKVFEAYKTEKMKYSMSDWIDQLIGIARDLLEAFKG